MMIIIDNEDGDYDDYEDENDVYNDSAGDDGLMLETMGFIGRFENNRDL